MKPYQSVKISLKKIYKEKKEKEKERIQVDSAEERKECPSVDPVTRFDCCDFDAHWSKWWSQSWSIGGEGSLHNVEFNMFTFKWECRGTSPGEGTVKHSLLQHCGSCTVLWWKAPEMCLRAVCVFLVVYDTFWNRTAACHTNVVGPVMAHQKGWISTGLCVSVNVLTLHEPAVYGRKLAW